MPRGCYRAGLQEGVAPLEHSGDSALKRGLPDTSDPRLKTLWSRPKIAGYFGPKTEVFNEQI